MVTSAFNPGEKVPSMHIYYSSSEGIYKFNDFSSGKHGTGYGLVMALFNLSASEAYARIFSDYDRHGQGYAQKHIQAYDRYKIVDYKARNWTTSDARYWTSFKIGSSELEHYNVMALEEAIMEKILPDGTPDRFSMKSSHLYGYFTHTGKLYKVYRPFSDVKFIHCMTHVQGYDQLTYEKPYLVIQSSLKDIMAFNALKYKTIECIAPSGGENTMISKSIMTSLLPKYENVCILFDNDAPGRASAEKYKLQYGLQSVDLAMEKDVSDSIRKYGLEHVKNILTPLLVDKLKTCKRCENQQSLV